MQGLLFMGYLCVFTFSSRLYKASIMKKLYLEKKDFRIRDQQRKRHTVSLFGRISTKEPTG
jgi:hypothetical protein